MMLICFALHADASLSKNLKETLLPSPCIFRFVAAKAVWEQLSHLTQGSLTGRRLFWKMWNRVKKNSGSSETVLSREENKSSYM